MDIELFKNLEKAFAKLSNCDIVNKRMEIPDPSDLVLDQDDLETHVLAQAPATSYYSYKLAEAERIIKALKDDYNKWFLIKKAEAGAQMMGSDPDGYKPSSEAKEARVYINCRQAKKDGGENGIDEDEEWRKKIRLAEEYRDVIKAWYDGYVAKNFQIKTYAMIAENDGRSLTSIKENRTPIEDSLVSFNPSSVKKTFKRIE